MIFFFFKEVASGVLWEGKEELENIGVSVTSWVSISLYNSNGASRQSSVLSIAHAHTTTKWVGKPPKLYLWPDPWTHPYPYPIRYQRTPSLALPGSGEGSVLLDFTPLHCSSGPSKALPEFPV